MPQPTFFTKLFTWAFPAPDDTADGTFERFRFMNYSVLLLLGIPIMLIFGVYHLRQHNELLSLLILLSAFSLIGGWLLTRKGQLRNLVYNYNNLTFIILLAYMLIIGGEGGSKILWFYTFPLICHFMLGKKFGLFWNSCAFILILTIFYAPIEHKLIYPYLPEFKLRFVVTYVTVSIFSCWFEALLNNYRTKMFNQNQTLKQALDEVKTLQGLLPICCYCHKICDEQGFWDQLEGYIQNRTDAKFSHGICPECAEEELPSRQVKAAL